MCSLLFSRPWRIGKSELDEGLQPYHPPFRRKVLNINLSLLTLLDLCVSSLRRGHANILCIVPILMDDPRRESILYIYIYIERERDVYHIYIYIYIHACICIPIITIIILILILILLIMILYIHMYIYIYIYMYIYIYIFIHMCTKS